MRPPWTTRASATGPGALRRSQRRGIMTVSAAKTRRSSNSVTPGGVRGGDPERAEGGGLRRASGAFRGDRPPPRRGWRRSDVPRGLGDRAGGRGVIAEDVDHDGVAGAAGRGRWNQADQVPKDGALRLARKSALQYALLSGKGALWFALSSRKGLTRTGTGDRAPTNSPARQRGLHESAGLSTLAPQCACLNEGSY